MENLPYELLLNIFSYLNFLQLKVIEDKHIYYKPIIDNILSRRETIEIKSISDIFNWNGYKNVSNIDFLNNIFKFNYVSNYRQPIELRNLHKKYENLPILKNLTLINLTNDEISDLPSNFSLFVNLKILVLSYNNFTEIPNCLFDLKSLSFLYLRSNRIRYIPDEIQNLKLEYLDLKGNWIVKVNPLIYKNIGRLDLKYNPLDLRSNVYYKVKRLSMKKIKEQDEEILDYENFLQ